MSIADVGFNRDVGQLAKWSTTLAVSDSDALATLL
jgi:hypothetical protein